MTTITFDTLKFVEHLKASGIPEAQAKAIVEAFRAAQGEAELATKRDLREVAAELKQALAELKADLHKTIIYALVAMTGIFAAIVKLF